MHAVVRMNAYDQNKLAVAADRLEQFDKLHEAQPGFVGSIVVDLESGRRLVLNLWGSEEHSAAALSARGPEVGRVLNPLMSAPSELVGVGTVVFTDLVPSTGT